jgi:hypothetical protein
MTYYTLETSTQDIQLSLESIQALIIQSNRVKLLFNRAWIWIDDGQLFSVVIDTWYQIQEDARDKKINTILEK